jgi:hypothetical protein
MDTALRDTFIRLWNAYFLGEELPITFAIGQDTGTVKKAPVPHQRTRPSPSQVSSA